MNILLFTLSYILVASLAFLLSFFVFRKTKSYSGTMKVTRDEDKIIYTLELNEDPIAFATMSEVVFRVDTSDKSSDSQIKLVV